LPHKKEEGWDSIYAIRHKKIHDSVRREILYNTVIELGVPMELV
jgi:hypothetical protein